VSGPGRADLAIRAARPDEVADLSALALRSKAHWGYDQAFIDACRPALTFTTDDVAGRRLSVACRDGVVLGVVSVEGVPPEGEIGHLWVEPDAIGAGAGRALFTHAVDVAAGLGFERLLIGAEPFAEGFYRAMGARVVGEVPSGSIPGRVLPLMRIDIAGA
jgi:GNAT superfamily N-acetyltransferase